MGLGAVEAGQGQAWLGGQGVVWRDMVWPGRGRLGEAGRGGRGQTGRGLVWSGAVWQGEPRRVRARRSRRS